MLITIMNVWEATIYTKVMKLNNDLIKSPQFSDIDFRIILLRDIGNLAYYLLKLQAFLLLYYFPDHCYWKQQGGSLEASITFVSLS